MTFSAMCNANHCFMLFDLMMTVVCSQFLSWEKTITEPQYILRDEIFLLKLWMLQSFHKKSTMEEKLAYNYRLAKWFYTQNVI